jgi:nucleoside-diphosphate-sugar epimerase
LRVLFIGGTGIISSACSQLAVDRGIELYLLNRGETSKRPVPKGAKVLKANIRDIESVEKALDGRRFDVVVDWIAFTPEHIETDLEVFTDRTDQYIFISSASAYHTPPPALPVTESTSLYNPVWQYSRDKIACEERLLLAMREEGFPMTIVRPSHTYDCTLFPMHEQYTAVHRIRQGKKIIVHGDGTSLWTLTHHRDFAKGFVGLLGNPHAIGEAFHITTDEILTWNHIVQLIAKAAGTEADIVHVPSEFIAAFDPEWGESLLGDKAHSMVFDNSKIKRTVPDFKATIPFARGAEEIINWFDEDPDRRVVDAEMNLLIDRIIQQYESAWPKKRLPDF